MKINLLMPDAVFEEFLHNFHAFCLRHQGTTFEMYCQSDEDGEGGLSDEEARGILTSLGEEVFVEELTKQ